MGIWGSLPEVSGDTLVAPQYWHTEGVDRFPWHDVARWPKNRPCRAGDTTREGPTSSACSSGRSVGRPTWRRSTVTWWRSKTTSTVRSPCLCYVRRREEVQHAHERQVEGGERHDAICAVLVPQPKDLVTGYGRGSRLQGSTCQWRVSQVSSGLNLRRIGDQSIQRRSMSAGKCHRRGELWFHSADPEVVDG